MTVVFTQVPASELRAHDRIRRQGMADIVRECVDGRSGTVELYLAYAGRVTLAAGELVELERNV